MLSINVGWSLSLHGIDDSSRVLASCCFVSKALTVNYLLQRSVHVSSYLFMECVSCVSSSKTTYMYVYMSVITMPVIYVEHYLYLAAPIVNSRTPPVCDKLSCVPLLLLVSP